MDNETKKSYVKIDIRLWYFLAGMIVEGLIIKILMVAGIWTI